MVLESQMKVRSCTRLQDLLRDRVNSSMISFQRTNWQVSEEDPAETEKREASWNSENGKIAGKILLWIGEIKLGDSQAGKYKSVNNDVSLSIHGIIFKKRRQ